MGRKRGLRLLDGLAQDVLTKRDLAARNVANSRDGDPQARERVAKTLRRRSDHSGLARA